MANISKTKLIKLDRMLSLFVLVSNWLAIMFSPLFGRMRTGTRAVPKLARTVTIAKFEGIGSILYALALARALKTTNPSVKIKFFTREENANFVSRFSEVDEIVVLRTASLFRLALSWMDSVFKARADIYIDLEVYSHFSALTSLATFSWWRAGFFRESANYRTGLYTHSVFFNSNRHVTVNYLQIARALGFDVRPIELPAPQVSTEEHGSIQANYRKQNPGSMLIAVNPHASDLLFERRWPVEKFASVLDSISGKYPNALFVITGSPSEKNYAEQIVTLAGEPTKKRVVNSAGKLSFGEFLALIKEADLLFTNDSGPLHLAFAFGTPSLSLWGPGDTKHYGPIHNEIHRVVENQVFCSPCIYQTTPPPCRGNNICMQKMPEREVAAHLSATLESIELGQMKKSIAKYFIKPWIEEYYSEECPSGVATNENLKTPLK
jgi:ADP-heptose:LPS heptosyltransferase